ncbi:MAG: dephospho-CoA kinase [Candidatus Sulfobium sp.]|jgi:dephospho-CoA kinase
MNSDYNRYMFITGLTGNYGMGKSFVLSLFRDLGAITIDSDRIVDGLLREGKVVSDMKKLLGEDVLDREGRLDKKAVAQRIFSDPASRRSVEALLHPLVLERVDHLVQGVKDANRFVVVEIPLLFEGNYGDRFRKTMTVFTSEETALERLEAEGVPRREALLRLNSQMPIDRKKELADYIIDNNGNMEETRERVKELYNSLIKDMKKQN